MIELKHLKQSVGQEGCKRDLTHLTRDEACILHNTLVTTISQSSNFFEEKRAEKAKQSRRGDSRLESKRYYSYFFYLK